MVLANPSDFQDIYRKFRANPARPRDPRSMLSGIFSKLSGSQIKNRRSKMDNGIVPHCFKNLKQLHAPQNDPHICWPWADLSPICHIYAFRCTGFLD
jgi:hypothetical protein